MFGALSATLDRSRAGLVTVDKLPDDALLEVFNFYMDSWSARTRRWHTLVQVCRGWRCIVFASPRSLGLLLEYTGKRPITEILDVWAVLPIVIARRTWRDNQRTSCASNIIAALDSENHKRICEIDLLHIPNSFWQRFAGAMQKPFPKLTYLELRLNENEVSALSDSFLGGSAPHLQVLRLRCIPFAAIQKLILSAKDLVDLQLVNIPNSGYISPQVMATCLSAASRLEILRLEFHSPPIHPNLASRYPLTRAVLPALTSFSFRGVSEYLEDLVARISAPLLHQLSIVFFMELIFDIPQLHRFISNTEVFKTLDRAMVSFFTDSVQFTLSLQAETFAYSKSLKLEVRCRESDWQLSSLALVCNSSLPPLSTLEQLYIMDGYPLPHWEGDMETTQWLELLHPFTAVKSLYQSRQVALGIGHALQGLAEHRATEVLPALETLFLEGHQLSRAVQEAVGTFVTSRQLSGHPVAVHNWDKEQEQSGFW